MKSRSPDYVKVRAAFAKGRRMTIEDISRLTGRDRLGAQMIVGNLKMAGEVVPVGKVGRATVYETAPRAPGADKAARTRAARHLQEVLKAFRIGPPPPAPLAQPRVVELLKLNAPDEAAA